MLVYGLSLALPITLVAHNVLQILVALDIFRAHNVRGILDHLLRQSRLTRYLDGEARTRLTYRQLEQGLHLVAVVEHRTVHHTLVILGKVLQVLIVGGNHAEGLLLPQLLQHGLCYGTADGGLCAAAELVY